MRIVQGFLRDFLKNMQMIDFPQPQVAVRRADEVRRFVFASMMLSLVSLVTLTLGGCSTNPATGQPQLVLLDEEDEALIGKTAHPRIVAAYGGAYEEGPVAAYVTSIVARIVKNSAQPDLAYTVTVLDSSLVNALALPGGYVYVTRGLLALANDEAELAGVIAHEIAHVNARHVAQRQTAAIGTSIVGALFGVLLGRTAADGIVARGTEGLLASYSREQESEADRLAVTYLTRGGYDPFAVRDFLGTISAYAALQARLVGEEYNPAQVGWLSSHPATAERIEYATEGASQAARVNVSYRRGKAQYYSAIDRLLYGERRESGYIRDRDFIHVVEGFRFTVPPRFRLANTPEAVWAIGPDKTIVKFDSATKPSGQTIARYLHDDWAAALAVHDLREFEINGLAAASARTRLQGLATRIVAIETSPTQVYRFLVGVPQQAKDRYETAITGMTDSFRTLRTAEADAIHPLRVRIATIAAGSTFEQLAAQMAFSEARLERFKLLNAIAPGDQPIVGSSVKLIVESR